MAFMHFDYTQTFFYFWRNGVFILWYRLSRKDVKVGM